jgi:hypothetical protein
LVADWLVASTGRVLAALLAWLIVCGLIAFGLHELACLLPIDFGLTCPQGPLT